jgi:hypothetical protein
LKAKFQLRFPSKDIQYRAARCENDDSPVPPLVAVVQARGFLTKQGLVTGCRWKTGFERGFWQGNPPDFFRHAKQCPFNTQSERLRIEVLTLLRGVN